MSKRTTKIIAGVLFTLFYAMILAAHYIQMQRGPVPTILSGVAPDFAWQAQDGSTHTLKELQGHPVVLHFWAAWCNPCRAEFPGLLKNAGTLGPDVVILAVSNDTNPEKAQKFIHEQETKTGVKTPKNMMYIFDPDRKITYDIFQTLAFPESIFIDRALHMRRKVPGGVDWENMEIRNYLAQLK